MVNVIDVRIPGLEERSAVLSLSVVFHHKAEAYAGAVGGWGAQCAVALQLAAGGPGAPPCSDPRALEQHAQRHRQLYEHMCQAYTEVSQCVLKHNTATTTNYLTIPYLFS